MPPINQLKNKTGIKHILVIDPSASHLAYVLMDIDFDKMNAGINSVGMLWVKSTYSKGQRFSYMQKCIKTLLNTVPVADAVYTEGFFVNPRLMMGVAVVPVINGLIELNCTEIHPPVEFSEIPPPSWRAALGIKPTVTLENGKKVRDYKTPTLDLVESKLGKLPEKIISNVTGKLRDTPHDVSDALAIALSVLREHGISKVEFYANTFYNKAIYDKVKEI